MKTEDNRITFDDLENGLSSEWEFLDDNLDTATFGVNVPDDNGGEEDSKPPVNDSENDDEGDSGEEFQARFEDELDEEDVDTGDSGDAEEEEDEGGEDDLYSYLGKTLAEQGIIAAGEDSKFESEEDIYKSVQETINKGIDSWKQSLGEESLRYIDYLEKGGDPAKYIEVNAQTDFSTVNLDSDEAKKEVISAYYKEKGFSEKKINRLIENAEDLEELGDEAKEAQEYFVKQKEAQKEALLRNQAEEAELRQKRTEEFNNNVQEYIDKMEEVRNFPLNTKKQKEEIASYIFDRNVPFRQPDGSVVKISQYMKDKMERNSDDNARFEDVVFDALIMKYGSAPIQKKTLSDRNKKLADIAKNHRRKSTSGKLSSSGGKGTKPRTGGKYSFDDWGDL